MDHGPASRRPRRSRSKAAQRWLRAGVILAAAAGFLPAIAAGHAASLKIDYRITLAGLTLGHADLTGTIASDRYDLAMQAQMTGVAGLLTGSGRGGANAKGAFAGGRIVPAGFSAVGQVGSARRTVQIGVERGDVTEVKIEPPFPPVPDRVPLSDDNERGIVDPLSAVMAMASGRDKPDGPAACNRTVPVFDGTQRFDVILSYAETKAVEKAGFKGDVLVCSVRYRPVAGHRPERPAVKFMQDTKEISVWLAPVDGTRVLLPIRISVPTLYGTSVVEAEKWTLDRTKP